MNLTYIRQRGQRIGEVLTPHQGKDGLYVASPDRFKDSQCKFETAAAAIIAAITNGWGIRMSCEGVGPASLIRPEKCENYASFGPQLERVEL